MSESRVTDHPLYMTWWNMIARCHREANADHHLYGGRGISVCRRWRESFDAFLADMGPKPSQKHQLDRKDSEGDYCPENCRWATPKENCRNKRSTKRVVIHGKTMALADACELPGAVPYERAKARLRLGWPDEDAVFGEKYSWKQTRKGNSPEVDILGETMLLRDACRIEGAVPYCIAYNRIVQQGWPATERAVFAEKGQKREVRRA